MRNEFALMTLSIALFTGQSLAQPNWQEILGTSKTQVIWRDDLQKALAEAQAQNKPLLVTLRCLPCKQCSAFDKDVMEGGPLLSPLLSQFITVRLTDAKELDYRIFIGNFQDYDLSWWGYFLSPEGRIYGIFGGKDEVSDA